VITTVINLGLGKEIIVKTENGGGTIHSHGLKINHVMDAEDAASNASIDGVESLILAMANEGMDVGTPQMRKSVETALDAIENN
jgi:hypothetical protein